MNYRIAICDDVEADRRFIADMVNGWSQQRGYIAKIDKYTSAENFLFNYTDHDYDILLLDIEMDDMDGVTLAKKLRRSTDTIRIVFITGYSDYIAEGYDVMALHYLMKLVKEEKLFETLDRAVDKLAKNDKTTNLDAKGEMIRLPIYKIKYLWWGPNDIVSASNGEMKKRYGFIYVDVDDAENGSFKRIKKDSFYEYRSIIEKYYRS